MPQNNGWFQLESQHAMKNPQSQNRGISGSRIAPEPKSPVQNTAMANDPNAFAPSQKSHPENMSANRSRPQGILPLQTPAAAPAALRPQTVSERILDPELGNILSVPLGALAYARMNDQNAPAHMQHMPDNAGYYRQQSKEPSGANSSAPSAMHSQTVGERGPVLEQDSVLHETLETFVHTKIIERPVHVKGYGAFGTFQTMQSMTEFTKLGFLQAPGQRVPVTARFSLAVSNKGTPDTSRGVRGFSVKFYTQEGPFDLLCNHIPVLFVRDGIRFPEAVKSFLPSPVNNLADPEQLWGFIALAPEATHFITWLFSDVGTVKSLRHIRGFGVNTYVWRNAEGVRRYVKYHWLPLAGEQYLDRQEAAALAGANPDIAGQELYDTIAAGNPAQYELRVQLMNPEDENTLPFDPLDCTKVWDEARYPLLPVGRLTLDRNPGNYMEQVEKVAFSPANLLDGAELSDDKLLQARANIYWDSQRRRLGPNFRKIPVNNQENWTPQVLVTSGSGRQVEGRLVRSELPNPDNFTQAGQHYLSLSAEMQDHLVDNLAADLATVSGETQRVVLGYLHNASAELGDRVAAQIAHYAGR